MIFADTQRPTEFVMFLFCLICIISLHHFVAPPPMFILCCFSCILELCFSYFTAFCLHCCIVFSFCCTIALLVLRCFNCIDFLVVVVLSLQGIVIEKGGTMGASIVRSCAGIHRRNFALQRSSEGHWPSGNACWVKTDGSKNQPFEQSQLAEIKVWKIDTSCLKHIPYLFFTNFKPLSFVAGVFSFASARACLFFLLCQRKLMAAKDSKMPGSPVQSHSM